MSIFNKTKKSDLEGFIDLYSNFAEINKENIYNIFKNKEENVLINLEKKWYDSLPNNPDYNIYNNEYYIFDTWICWFEYSRNYLNLIKNQIIEPDKKQTIIDKMERINNILDLGCGLGYSTIGLKEIFPNSRVYATNIKDSYQYKIASYFGDKYGFEAISDFKELKNIDFIFASEYFEHIENPVEHLENILDILNPKFLVIANSFGSHAMGHFHNYKVKNEIVSNKKIGRVFNNILRQKGYIKEKTGFWNNRPSFWRRNEKSI